MTTEEQETLAAALHRATLLSTHEWRTIHNALADRQSAEMRRGSITDSAPDWARIHELQRLMNKIRDNFIAQPVAGQAQQTNSQQ